MLISYLKYSTCTLVGRRGRKKKEVGFRLYNSISGYYTSQLPLPVMLYGCRRRTAQCQEQGISHPAWAARGGHWEPWYWQCSELSAWEHGVAAQAVLEILPGPNIPICKCARLLAPWGCAQAEKAARSGQEGVNTTLNARCLS